MSTPTRRRAEPKATELACDCGAPVRRVPVEGAATLLDIDVDPQGEVTERKVNRRTAWMPAGPPGGPEPRYRIHRCRVTGAAEELSRQAHSRTDTAGPCARCWSVTVPHRYGPNAETLCPKCRKEVDARRSA